LGRKFTSRYLKLMAPSFHPDSLPDLESRVYVVTGGNTGIGYHTVLHLAKHNAKVYLCCRNAVKGNEAIAGIKAQVPYANVQLLVMVLMGMESVIAAAKEVLSKEAKLHGLINSAGIMATPFEMTADGYESQIQTNYLSHWVLTYHLLPLLRKTAATSAKGDVRIVNVSSMGHKQAPSGGINFADINLKEKFTFSRYAQSKLANVLHAKALNKRFGPQRQSAGDEGEIWVASLHPGNVDTQLNTKAAGSIAVPVLRFFGVYIEPEQGSFTSLYAAASPDFKAEDSGAYFVPIAQKGKPSTMANNPELAEKLWAWTENEMRSKGFIQ
jgi:NAD(P)-dependent dehydrogenase (short-subunit alcohol dehydrogenase family)